MRNINALKDLDIDISPIECPSDLSQPERFWPLSDVNDESLRRNQLDSITKEVVKNKPDAVIVHHRAITLNLLRSKIPLIVLEHTDGTALEWSRHFIHLPQIIGVIKGSVYTEKNFYNSQCCEGMLHGTYLNKKYGLNLPNVFPIKKINFEDMEKIELGYSFGCFPQNERFINCKNYKRDLNISFIGNTDFKRSILISNHRNKAISSLKTITNSFYMDSSKGKISQKEFDKVLYKSKFCLSPYGYGVCFRDFEALYAGCILIQPNKSYMKTWPNIYKKNYTYVECKNDFSDLEQVINNVNENNWKQNIINNRNMLLDYYWNSEKLTLLLHDIIQRCVGRI